MKEPAANLKARKDLALAIGAMIRSWNVTQMVAAEWLGITQPRINDLLRGRIDRFSVDALINLAPRAGVQVQLTTVSLHTSSPEIGTPTLTVNATDNRRRPKKRRKKLEPKNRRHRS